jgi:tetratricopeptide (TPR) repeat protein
MRSPLLLFLFGFSLCISSAVCEKTLFASEDFQQEKHAETYQTLINQADQLFNAALYEKAIPIYRQIMQAIRVKERTFAISSKDQATVRYRLAQSYFLSDNYQAAIAALQQDDGILNYGNGAKELYLLGISYRKRGNFEKATDALKEYLDVEKPALLSFYDEAHFELALAYFLLGKFDEAKSIFASISQEAGKGDADALLPRHARAKRSLMYLARIAELKGNNEEAQTYLETLKPLLVSNDILRYELAYLQGEAFFQKHDYPNAIANFKQALPQNNAEKIVWYSETLYQLGWSYMHMAMNETVPDLQRNYFDQAEGVLVKLSKHSQQEKDFLALGQYYLTRARCLKDMRVYEDAEKLLKRQDIFTSREAQAHALLLRAEAAPTYALRDSLYRHLTQEGNCETPFFAKGWYLRGLNDFEEGQVLLSQDPYEANCAFERAVSSLEKAFELLVADQKKSAGLALKYQAQASYLQNTEAGSRQALSTLNFLIKEHPEILMSLEDPDEIYYLQGLIAMHLAGANNDLLAESYLQQGLVRFPKGKFAGAMLNLLGILAYQHHDLFKAKATFLKVATEHPADLLAGEALFWAARCADNTQDMKDYRCQVYEHYPQSPFAAEAYFLYYSYPEYLQGDRAAIKHLQAMPMRYPHSPFTMNAWYLIGLDYKRDRKTPEGKWICRRNLTAAIDAFQEVESTFDALHQTGLLKDNVLEHYVTVRYRATLERALTNLAIAEESEGAKRQIYLEYATDVFRQIDADFKNPQHLLYPQLTYLEACGHICEESAYWLAQAYLKANQDSTAEGVLTEMVEKYRSAKVTRGYFLARTWSDLGLIAASRQDFKTALHCYRNAEDASKGKVLNTDQRLELWIQQSLCYQALGERDQAILLLSKVVNDDAISGLRVKAMYLRAEIYEAQGRSELARKQLVATSKKGGEWSFKAKTKLDKEYGYQ